MKLTYDLPSIVLVLDFYYRPRVRAKVQSTRTGAHPAGASLCEQQVRSAGRSEEHLDAVKVAWIHTRSPYVVHRYAALHIRLEL